MFNVLLQALLISCECRVFSDGIIGVELISRPEESYRVWFVLNMVVNAR